jgi:hypothetical protein
MNALSPRGAWPVVPLLLWLSFSLGCRQELPKRYGCRGGFQPTSVNGTAVFADMVQRAKHSVYSWNRLSPRLRDDADCIVWFPDDFEPPTDEQCDWLETWLARSPGRTLIYVGRHYDAAPKYWRQAARKAPAEQKAVMLQNAVAADDKLQSEMATISGDECAWFRLQKDRPALHVSTLEGSPDWVASIEPSACDVELAAGLVPWDDAQRLVWAGGDAIVSRIEVEQSQILLVANGSLLLNHCLINHEHRKIAGRLIDEIGPPRKTVVFLESRAGGPPIVDDEPQARRASPWALFHTWPMNWILLHLLVAGAIFCFSRWPIFGLPRSEPADALSDFGKHVHAVGLWLARTRDAAFAHTRLQHYRQMIDDA